MANRFSDMRSDRYLGLMGLIVRYKNENRMTAEEIISDLRMAEEQFRTRSRGYREKDARQMTIIEAIG